MKNLKLCFLFILTSFIIGCSTSPTGRGQFLLVSPEEAIFSSKEAYIQTLKPLQEKGKIDNNSAITQRVRTITGKIISQAIEQYPHTSNWDWRVKVIDDKKTVNAWCMAGGKMAIYTGLLVKVKPTDDELAQVMGHEIAHALANHTAEKMSVAMASSIGIIGVGILLRNQHYAGAALTGAALAATVAIKLPNSRTAEEEADLMGIELAARAGYNPNAAATLWEKMGKAGGETPPEFLSTHPAPGNRQKRLKELAPKMMSYYKEKKHRPVYLLN